MATVKLSEKLDAWDVQEGHDHLNIEWDSWTWLKREVVILEERLREYQWQATTIEQRMDEVERANEHLRATLDIAARELPHDHGILALQEEERANNNREE